MKKIFLVLAVVSISNFAFSQALTSPKEVIDKYLKVTKISDLASQITDLTMSYTSESPRGVAETEFKYMFPYKMGFTVFASGMEIMSSKFDGNTQKRVSNFGGQAAPDLKGYAALLEAQKSNPFFEAEFEKLKISTKLLANEKDNDQEYYVIEATDSLNKSWKDYYNVKTGLKDKSYSAIETPKGNVDSWRYFENYKAFKGSEILFSSKKRQETKMGEIVSELQTIKVNKGLKAKEFEIK